MLNAISPKKINKRLKLFLYGPPKVGKTTCSIQFPQPYLIDTEGGAVHDQYVDLLTQQEGAIFQCTQAEEVLKEIQALRTENHPYKTLIIDSVTILYSNLINYLLPRTAGKFGEPYNSANQLFLPLIYSLIELDMNVVVTAHSKIKYESSNVGGKLKMEATGDTFDCYKKIPFLFDLIIEAQYRGGQRVGIVKGSRLANFKEDETFEFNYKSFAERYDLDRLERETIPEKLVSAELLDELTSLRNILNISETIVSKWLAKANVVTLAEMNETSIIKCIDHLKSKLPTEK